MICSQVSPAGDIARLNPLLLANAVKTFIGLGAHKNLKVENLAAVVTIPSCDIQTFSSGKSRMRPVSSPLAHGITGAPPGTDSSTFAHACCEDAYRSSSRNFGTAVDTCRPEPMRWESNARGAFGDRLRLRMIGAASPLLPYPWHPHVDSYCHVGLALLRALKGSHKCLHIRLAATR